MSENLLTIKDLHVQYVTDEATVCAVNGIDLTLDIMQRKYDETGEKPIGYDLIKSYVDKGWCGKKTGRGFYDYTDVDIEELKIKRDKQLFEIFKVAKKFMDDPV